MSNLIKNPIVAEWIKRCDEKTQSEYLQALKEFLESTGLSVVEMTKLEPKTFKVSLIKEIQRIVSSDLTKAIVLLKGARALYKLRNPDVDFMNMEITEL